MQPFFESELNVYCKMFRLEQRKSAGGLQILSDIVHKFQECAKNFNNIYEVQRNIRLLSIFCEIIQAFNTNIETLVSSIDDHLYAEVMAISPNAHILRIKDWQPNLSCYQVDEQFDGAVSYVLDAESKLCFIVDVRSEGTVNGWSQCLESMFEGIPQYGYVFALEINKKFFRAVRIDSEASNMAIRVRLIDIGETISVSPNTYKFNLIEYAQRVPPLAILCRVIKLNGKVMNTLEPLLKKTFRVKINDICVNMLEVELRNDTENGFDNDSLDKSIIDSVANTSNEDEVQTVSTPSPSSRDMGAACSTDFVDEVPEPSNFVTVKHDDTSPVSMKSPNEFENVRMKNHNETVPAMRLDSTPPTKMMASTPKTAPTRSQIPPVPPRQRPPAMLPLKIPLDIVHRRQQACDQFGDAPFNPNNNSNDGKENEHNNSNGNHKIEDGNTSNGHKCNNGPCACLSGAHPKSTKIPQDNGFISSYVERESMPMPLKGEEKAVLPTHIVKADLIYVQFAEWYTQFEDYQFNTLQKLPLRQLSYIPKLNDCVLAQYAGDNLIYRARVESIEQQNVTVFYVDYGNTESIELDSLFEWDPLCDTLPFQAVSCRLANVRRLPSSSAQNIFEFIQQNYLNKMCKAVVMDSSENSIIVYLKNGYGTDIVDDINVGLQLECIDATVV